MGRLQLNLQHLQERRRPLHYDPMLCCEIGKSCPCAVAVNACAKKDAIVVNSPVGCHHQPAAACQHCSSFCADMRSTADGCVKDASCVMGAYLSPGCNTEAGLTCHSCCNLEDATYLVHYCACVCSWLFRVPIYQMLFSSASFAGLFLYNEISKSCGDCHWQRHFLSEYACLLRELCLINTSCVCWLDCPAP
jgi:hypothetical protein